MEEKDNRPVGVFDSGIGGLTVLKRLQQLCPNENYIYFGDYKNLPYGEKSKEELLSIIKKIFDFFESKNVKAVVMACNTSSAQVYEEFKDSYSFKLFPIIQAASASIALDKEIKKIGILATKSTINSQMYSKSLKKTNPSLETIEMACPQWVSIVENKVVDFDEDEVLLKHLKPVLEFKPDKIILGCTHYPYLIDRLKKYAPREMFLNPADSFSACISKDLKKNSSSQKGETEFFVSASPELFLKNSSVFIEIETEIKEVGL